MAISVTNLDAPLGAVVRGIDLGKPLAPGECETIAAASRTRLVVIADGQTLSDPQLLRFSRYFGELDPPGPNPYGEPFNKEFPEINVISNVVENGKPIGGLGDGEAVWHADMTYVDVPPKAAILHALEVPPHGGNTYFADMFAAYEALPGNSSRPSSASSPCTTPRATAPDCCARATRRSATFARPSAPAIRWCAPIRRPAARHCFSAGDRTAM